MGEWVDLDMRRYITLLLFIGLAWGQTKTIAVFDFTSKDTNRFAINLAVGSIVKEENVALQDWSYTNNFRASVELPLLMQVLIVGLEVGTFKFEHDMPPKTDTYSGFTIMGITGLSAGPLKIKVGAGKVGSSKVSMKEGSLGFRIGGILDIWGGIRSTDVIAASSTESLELGDLSWEEVCVGITYNWIQ